MKLTSGELEAEVHPDAGMVVSSLRHRGAELLGQRQGLDAYRERGATMGIPLLFPWANRLSREHFELLDRAVDATGARRDEQGRPIHGLLGAAPDWRVVDSGPDRVRAAHGWEGDLLRAFPFAQELELEVVLAGSTLTLSMVVNASGTDPVPISLGFHPYLVLPDLPREEWHVELAVPGGHAGPLGDLHLDDAYPEVEPDRPFVLAGGGRRIEVRFGPNYP